MNKNSAFSQELVFRRISLNPSNNGVSKPNAKDLWTWLVRVLLSPRAQSCVWWRFCRFVWRFYSFVSASCGTARPSAKTPGFRRCTPISGRPWTPWLRLERTAKLVVSAQPLLWSPVLPRFSRAFLFSSNFSFKKFSLRFHVRYRAQSRLLNPTDTLEGLENLLVQRRNSRRDACSTTFKSSVDIGLLKSTWWSREL